MLDWWSLSAQNQCLQRKSLGSIPGGGKPPGRALHWNLATITVEKPPLLLHQDCPYPLLRQAWPPKSWPPPRCPVTTNSSCLVRCALTRRSSKYRQAISFCPTFRASWLPWKGEGQPPQFRVLGNSFPLLWISTNIAVDIFNQIGNYFQAQAALRRTRGEQMWWRGELKSTRRGTTVIQMLL